MAKDLAHWKKRLDDEYGQITRRFDEIHERFDKLANGRPEDDMYGRLKELEKRVKKKRGVKVIRMDVRALVRELAVEERDGRVLLSALIGRRSGNLGRPREVLVALFGLDPDAVLDAKTHKTESYVEFDGRLVSVGAGWAGAVPFDPWGTPRAAEAVA